MPKSGTLFLFELVKSLSKSEKRYCTLFLTRNSSGRETGLKNLFHALDGLEAYSDSELLQSVPELDRRKLPNAKLRLYNRLLQALRLYYAGESTSSTIREHLQSAEILYKKGLFESCWKLLEKCKVLAYEHELIHMLPEIINWQKRRLVLRIRSQDTKTLHKVIVDEEQRVHTMLLDTLAAEELSSRLYAIFIRTGRVVRPTAAVRSQLTELYAELEDKKEKYLSGATSFWEGLYLNTASYQYYQSLGVFEEAYDLALRRLLAYNSKAFMLRDEPVLYTYALNSCIICQLVLGKYAAAEENLLLLREFGRTASGSATAPSTVSVFETANFLELEMYIRRGDFEAALRIVAQIVPQLGSYDKAMHNVNVFSKYYRIALACFGSGDLARALRWVNDVCNEGELVSRADIYVSVRMLNILIQYELEQYELLEYLAEGYRRDFQRLERLHATEDAVLQCFRRMPQYTSRAERHAALQELLNVLLQLRQAEPLDCYAFAYFNLCDWIQAQVSGKTYAEVIQGKERLESDVALHAAIRIC